MKQPVIFIDKLAGLDYLTAGGKAANLARAIDAGLPVPPGFVVSSEVCGKMTSKLSNEILKAYDNLGSHYVAVRSSAINEDGHEASWAGQLETYLNVDKPNLISRIEDCWTSTDSARAKAYAKHNKVSTKQLVAVLVQAMLNPSVSGVAFSAHPVTQNDEQVVIEAVFGLGEALVSGAITPDTYVLNKSNFEQIETHLGPQTEQLVCGENGSSVWQPVLLERQPQPKLNQKQLRAVAELTVRAEKFFGYPVDIEWAIDDNTLYLLQSRPITTLKTT